MPNALHAGVQAVVTGFALWCWGCTVGGLPGRVLYLISLILWGKFLRVKGNQHGRFCRWKVRRQGLLVMRQVDVRRLHRDGGDLKPGMAYTR